MRKNTIYIWLFFSIAISIIIQVVGITAIDPIDKYDSKEYLTTSGSLFNGRGYSIEGTSFNRFESFKGEAPTRLRQPGYPFYLVLFYWIAGERVIVTQLSQVLLNILTFYLLFLIARETYGNSLWKGTLLAMGLYFPLWLTSAYVMTETLFTFMVALFMYTFLMAVRSNTQNSAKFALVGFLMGLSALIRPVAYPIALMSIFPILKYIKGFRKALFMWGVLIIAFFVTLMPWTLRNYLVLGDFTFLSTDGGYNFWNASLGEDEPKWFDSAEFLSAVEDGYYIDREANNRFIKLAMGHIKKDPVGYFMRGVRRVGWVWSYFPGSQNFREITLAFGLFTTIQFLILLCAALGVQHAGMRTATYYLFPAIGISCILLFTKATSRFIVPAMPYILILAGQGFWLIKRKLRFFENAN